jgi:hypothetical protein
MAGTIIADYIRSDANKLSLNVGNTTFATINAMGLLSNTGVQIISPTGTINAASIAAGTIPAGALAAGSVARTNMFAGSVLQVSQAVKTDTWSTSGFTFADITGLSVTLTPTSVNSKFLIMTRVIASSNYWATYVNLLRNGTQLFAGDAAGNRPTPTSFYGTNNTDSNDNGFVHIHNIIFLDSPNTTNQVTYKLQGAGRSEGGSRTMYVNRSVPDRASGEYDARAASSLVVMEIAG